MNQDTANKLICAVRWGQGMLQILDEHKDQPATTIGDLQKIFESRFTVSPSQPWFYFNNQDQFLTLLWAYLCVPSERFHDDLPVTKLPELDGRWGLSAAKISGPPTTLRAVVKALRNSVSHANISVLENPLRFKFLNREQTIEIDEQSLRMFCRALNYWCLTADANLERLDG
jgi:hypothetical protein